MIFLIHYDRALGRIIKLQKFDDGDRAAAETSRFALELANLQKASIEVVLLEAASEEGLRKTHRRYFETLEELIEPASTGR
ncbi:MAG: hypothetical protein ABIP90_06220 [Vicinamibacterales bacterium]